MNFLRQYFSVWAMESKIGNRWRYKPSYDEAPVAEDENSILWKEKKLHDKRQQHFKNKYITK